MSSGGSTAADAAASAFAIDRVVDLVAIEDLLDGGKPQRPVGDTDSADMGVARFAALFVVEQHRRGHREVAAAAGEFLKAETALGRPCRQADFGDDFVRLERGHQRTLKEIRRVDHARAGFADDGDLRLAGHDDARHFGGGIGMRDAAADGAAIANLIMRDMLDGRDQERMRLAQSRVVEDVAPAHHGAERDAVIRDLDLPQLGELAQIDQQRRRGDAERQHRHQALAAGQRLGLAVVRGEQRNRFGDRGRAGVFEGR